jgi:hypothetical protein
LGVEKALFRRQSLNGRIGRTRRLELIGDALAGFRKGVEGMVYAAALFNESGGKQSLQVIRGGARRDIKRSGNVAQERSLPVEGLHDHSTRVMSEDFLGFRRHCSSTIHVTRNSLGLSSATWIYIYRHEYVR